MKRSAVGRFARALKNSQLTPQARGESHVIYGTGH
jgi:hypothetical protein